jgi:hypothetical protein
MFRSASRDTVVQVGEARRSRLPNLRITSPRGSSASAADVTRVASLGFTVKSGWAAAVLLGGPIPSPRVLDVCRIELSDPSIPESRQPNHEGFGRARVSGAKLSRLVASVERFGRQSVASLIRKHEASEHTLRGAGIVVGSLIDPERIANDHIRIHALEGRLFRRVVEAAAAEGGLASAIWRQLDLYASAAEILGEPEERVRATIAQIARPAGCTWRAEQKVATLAAWLVLTGRPPRTSETVRKPR